MKKYIVLFLTLILLSSCSVIGNIPKFPDAPENINKNCQDLLLIKETENKLSETLQVIVENYGRYHECKIQNDAWVEWYQIQKKIYSEIK